MFVGMGYEEWTTDRLEEELIAAEAERSRLAATDLAILEELDSRQVATGDGCRSLSEWTASRLDVSLQTAKSLVRTMRRTSHRPDLREGWLGVRSVSTGWKPYPASQSRWDGWNISMWPECTGRRPCKPGSAQKPEQTTPPTSI